MIITCIIIATLIVSLLMYIKTTESYCNCANFGTRKIRKPTYYNYSQDDTSRYGVRDPEWPIGAPYDAYSTEYKLATRKKANQYALDNCGVKFVEMPSTGYKSAKKAPQPPTYVSTPEGCRLPIMSDGLPPISMNPAGSFVSPTHNDPKTCASFSPYSIPIGVL